MFFGVTLLGLAVFAGFSEIRSCFLKERHTDFGVYLRAAYAARTGGDMYQITDDHGWHYCYPPPFALLLTPLADPPSGADRTGFVPFWFATAVWIVISLLVAIWTVHVLAKAVLPDAKPWSRRWLYARTVPFSLCIGSIGFTVSHGQVNTAVAALIAGMFVAFAADRRIAAGAWLAAAAALKITPALLVLYPLLHRDRRSLIGLAAGSIVLLGILPVAFFGFQGAIDENRKLVHQVLAPGLGGSAAGDQTRAKELTNTTMTDSISFVSVIHTWKHPEDRLVREHTTPDADQSSRLAHWAISGLMIAITSVLIWKNRTKGAAEQLLLLGSLVLVMILAAPVSHNHHFAMALPALCGLWLWGLKQRPGQLIPSAWVLATLVSWTAGTAILLLPGQIFVQLREFGLGTAVTVLLWAVGLATANRKANAAVEGQQEPQPLAWAA